jgi:hypothetical protein
VKEPRQRILTQKKKKNWEFTAGEFPTVYFIIKRLLYKEAYVQGPPTSNPKSPNLTDRETTLCQHLLTYKIEKGELLQKYMGDQVLEWWLEVFFDSAAEDGEVLGKLFLNISITL